MDKTLKQIQEEFAAAKETFKDGKNVVWQGEYYIITELELFIKGVNDIGASYSVSDRVDRDGYCIATRKSFFHVPLDECEFLPEPIVFEKENGFKWTLDTQSRNHMLWTLNGCQIRACIIKGLRDTILLDSMGAVRLDNVTLGTTTFTRKDILGMYELQITA